MLKKINKPLVSKEKLNKVISLLTYDLHDCESVKNSKQEELLLLAQLEKYSLSGQKDKFQKCLTSFLCWNNVFLFEKIATILISDGINLFEYVQAQLAVKEICQLKPEPFGLIDFYVKALESSQLNYNGSSENRVEMNFS